MKRDLYQLMDEYNSNISMMNDDGSVDQVKNDAEALYKQVLG